ncbi:hypothetical protein V1511DRAFT_489195 [Dipodascopsis uninucleata]
MLFSRISFLFITNLLISGCIAAVISGTQLGSLLDGPLRTRNALDTVEPLDRDISIKKGGGGGGGGKGGGSSGGSSGGKGGGSSSGATSPMSNSGGRSSKGSGVSPYVGGRYYPGGVTVPYSAGVRSPSGLVPGFFASALMFHYWPMPWPYGAYWYAYPHPVVYQNVTRNACCICENYAECGCDNNTDTDYLNNLPDNITHLTIINDTQYLLINGTLDNGTTAAGVAVSLKPPQFMIFWVLFTTIVFYILA